MAKSYSTCGGCGQPKMVNYAGLCKRCARNPKYASIVEHAIEEHEHEAEVRAEVQHEREEHEAEKAEKAEKAAAAEKDEKPDEKA